MSASEVIILAGLCAIPVGFILAWRLKAKGVSDDLGQSLPLDVCMFFVWGGMLLVQAANIVLHKQTGSLYDVSGLTWGGSASVLFVFGCVAGRLSLRLEMRRYKQRREAQNSN